MSDQSIDSPKRKPAGMSWQSFTDALIHDAMRGGAFDSIDGKGKPIPGLDEPYNENWWLSAYLKREKLSLPCEALDLRREVEQSLLAMMNLRDQHAVRREVDKLNVRIAKVNSTISSGPPSSIAKLDVEKIVEQWKSSREK